MNKRQNQIFKESKGIERLYLLLYSKNKQECQTNQQIVE